MPGASASWFQRKRTRDLAVVACFLLPALTIFFLYRILPLGWNVLLSFHSWSPLKAAKWIGVEHYEEMLLDDDVFWDALSNTLVFIGCSPIAIVLAPAVALLVNSDLKGAAVYPHHRLPVLPADDGGGRHHLALALRRARRLLQLRAALARRRRPADQVPAELRLGAGPA
jgi:hypothetical protein